MHQPSGHITDFDFLAGTWHVTHRRLRRRWVGSSDWDVFEGTTRCEQHLGGMVSVDDVHCPDRLSAMAIRVFDPATRQWAISWIDRERGRLEPAVQGGFENGVGTFSGSDTDGDHPVTVLFRWTVSDRDHARWQQSFSVDETTWEVNWIMDFARM